MTTALATIKTSEFIGCSLSTQIDDLANDWLAFVDVQPSTLATYNRALKNFTKWMSNNSVDTLNREVAIRYRDSILQSLAPSTCRLYVAAVRLFIKFLASKGFCANFTDNFKGVKLDNDVHSRAALDVDECKEVFHGMKGSTEKALRDKAIVGLMMSTGLRCIEITRLDCGDIQQRGKKMFLKVHGKARQGKVDRVQLPAQCAALINDYLKTRKNVCDSAPLFTSTSNRCSGQRLQSQTISRLCKKVLTNAGFAGNCYTAHSLRHSFASNALSAGVQLYDVSKALRHKSVTVTQIYIHDLKEWNNPAASTVANLIF